jgi:hypothetical protein
MLFQVLADYTKKILAGRHVMVIICKIVPETGFFFAFSFWL